MSQDAPVLRLGGYVVIPKASVTELMFVPVADISLPDNHCAMDLGHVNALVGNLAADEHAPPILVSRSGEDRYHLIDGRHRFVAALILGRYAILAVVTDEIDLRR